MIDVFLYGGFRDRAQNARVDGESVVRVGVRPCDTIGDVVRRIGIETDRVSLAFLNAEYSLLTRPVKPGDRLGIFPREMGLLYRQYFEPKGEGSA